MFSFAQDSLQTERKSIITFSLLSPTLSLAPRYSVGYVHKLNSRWWAGLEAGYGNDGINIVKEPLGDSDVTGSDYRLFELRPELYYDIRNRGKLKHTVSLEVFYINHRDRFITDKYRDKSESRWYEYDAADYKRIKTGFNLNYGVLYYLTPKLMLWQKMGVGLKNRNVKYDNFVNNRPSERYDNDDDHFDLFGMDSHLEKEGNYFGFNFNMELKLAYQF
ncbi:hypothetical protein AM493_14795 [Flavobacterium akiainvivens]|uniref:Outer membrane protein beta-barrel domain-containing protein n=2 Tax=Flavobacterium akiainvivens TaxID=1202724 RepID=A0A0M8MJN0_9FLAO|nr:hypothetical protein AM493_14795 [Flavobacterium akiainvivens]